MTALVILAITTWVIAVIVVTYHLIRPALRAAARAAQPTAQAVARRLVHPPAGQVEQWVRDSRCGCAWTLTRPLLTRPCSPAHKDLAGIMTRLRPYEMRDLADVGRAVRWNMPHRKAPR